MLMKSPLLSQNFHLLPTFSGAYPMCLCRWRTTGCSHGRAAAARQAVCGTCRWVAGCVSPSEQAAKMHAEKLASAAGRRPPAPGWPPGHSGPPRTASAAPGMGGGADAAPALDVRFVLPPQASGTRGRGRGRRALRRIQHSLIDPLGAGNRVRLPKCCVVAIRA